MTFSMPIEAMCTGGSVVPMSALPSLVTTTNPPVSAMAKLTPVSPASAPRNFSRRCWRARSVSWVGSERPAGVPSFSWKSSPISSFFRWMAGMTMCDGGSPASWTMRSPRSVSTTSMPRASRYGFRWHSSVSIDFDFTIRLTPRFSRISWTIRLCSAPSRAQWTCMPFAVALRSNSSRYSASRERVWALMPSAVERRLSHSGTVAAPRSRFTRTNQRALSCQWARSSSCTKARALSGWKSDHRDSLAFSSISATCTMGSFVPSRRARPSRCMRQDMS